MSSEIDSALENLRETVNSAVKSLMKIQVDFGKTYEGSECPYRSDKGVCALNLKPCVDTLKYPPINKSEKQYWLKCPVYNEALLKVSR